MQVHRLHFPEATPAPAHSAGTGNTPGVSGTQRSTSAGGDLPTTGLDSSLAAYLAQLREIPETRESVVARAREKVAGGDYLTRSSAEATAEVILRSV